MFSKRITGVLCTVVLLCCMGMTPQEAEDTYRANDCSMTSQAEDSQCFTCAPLQLPDGECVSPISLDVTVHWTPAWELPPVDSIPDPEPSILYSTPDLGILYAEKEAPQIDLASVYYAAGAYIVTICGEGPNASSDSIYIGVDGKIVATIDLKFWLFNHARCTSDTQDGGEALIHLTEGEHTINLWAREDGLVVTEVNLEEVL